MTMTFDTLRSNFTGMLDRTRMSLCMLMFTVLIFNPFNLLIGSNTGSLLEGGIGPAEYAQMGHDGGGGRKILGAMSGWNKL